MSLRYAAVRVKTPYSRQSDTITLAQCASEVVHPLSFRFPAAGRSKRDKNPRRVQRPTFASREDCAGWAAHTAILDLCFWHLRGALSMLGMVCRVVAQVVPSRPQYAPRAELVVVVGQARVARHCETKNRLSIFSNFGSTELHGIGFDPANFFVLIIYMWGSLAS
jgi:hypothetical protein